MSKTITLTGANLKVYISGKLYPEVQSLTYTTDYGEDEIYGIDSQFPQEIAPTRISVSGSITGLRLKLSGGLQGYDARSKINEILFAPYTSLRVKDRSSDIDIFWLPQMRVTKETFQANAKGSVKLSFSFKGIVPYNALDFN